MIKDETHSQAEVWITYELIGGALVAVENDVDSMTYSYRHPFTGERCEHEITDGLFLDLEQKIVAGRATRKPTDHGC